MKEALNHEINRMRRRNEQTRDICEILKENRKRGWEDVPEFDE